MFIELEARLLRRIITAESGGKPLTFEGLGIETQGSTYEDLWASGYLDIKGQEANRMCCTHRKDSAIVASPSGRKWLADYDRTMRA